MKQLRLKETPRAGGFNYTVFEADKPIAAWHSNRQVTSDVYVTIDSNGCFITHRTMPPKEIYGTARLGCCQECFFPSQDVYVGFVEMAVPEGCRDEECGCHIFDRTVKTDIRGMVI